MSLHIARPRGLAAVILTLSTVTASLAVAHSAHAVSGDRLYAGQKLTYGQSIVTGGGQDRLTMQPDGNLVEYVGTVAIWSTGTSSLGGSYASLQTDGNFVVYTAANKAVYNTGTQSVGNGAQLVMQSDGNVVLYNSAGHAAWANGKHYQAYAASLFPTYGWNTAQFVCLDKLWAYESGWNPLNQNQTSSAYGIPQAIDPSHNLAIEGADWRTNGETQVRWGIKDYISTPRYGSPCAAWNFELAHNYY